MTELQDKELNKLNNCRFTKLQAELHVVFNKREVVFYQSTKGRGRSPRPFVL